MCTACGNLLSVEVYCPAVGGPLLVHDISPSASWLTGQAVQ
jgi:hypothetical protein